MKRVFPSPGWGRKIGGWKNRERFVACQSRVSGLEFRLSGACAAATRGRVTRTSASRNSAIKQMTRPTRANVPPLSSSSRRRRKGKVLSIHEIEEDLKEDLISILFIAREHGLIRVRAKNNDRTRNTRCLTVAFRRQLPPKTRCRQIMCNFRDGSRVSNGPSRRKFSAGKGNCAATISTPADHHCPVQGENKKTSLLFFPNKGEDTWNHGSWR